MYYNMGLQLHPLRFMKGDIVHFNPCFGINEYKMQQAIIDHLRFCRNESEIGRLRNKSSLRYHAYRLSGSYQNTTTKSFGNFNTYGNDNYRKTCNTAYIQRQFNLWENIHSQGLIKTSNAPVLWNSETHSHVPDDEVEYKLFDGVQLWVKYELDTESSRRLTLPSSTSIISITNEPWKTYGECGSIFLRVKKKSVVCRIKQNNTSYFLKFTFYHG